MNKVAFLSIIILCIINYGQWEDVTLIIKPVRGRKHHSPFLGVPVKKVSVPLLLLLLVGPVLLVRPASIFYLLYSRGYFAAYLSDDYLIYLFIEQYLVRQKKSVGTITATIISTSGIDILSIIFTTTLCCISLC